MIEVFRAIIQYSHDVWIIVFVVIIERIEEDAKTIPFIRRSEYFTIVITLFRSVPKSLCDEIKNSRFIKNFKRFSDVSEKEFLTSPSAPILPRPETRNEISTSHQSKDVCRLVQMAPF